MSDDADVHQYLNDMARARAAGVTYEAVREALNEHEAGDASFGRVVEVMRCAVLALTEKARAETEEARATKDMHKARQQEAIADQLKAEAERDHWKANHDNAVAIKAAVLDRPDLGDRAKRVQELIAENTALRGLVAQLTLNTGSPCHYCGKNLNACPSGFPGCALADDLMLAEHDALMRREKLEPEVPDARHDAEF